MITFIIISIVIILIALKLFRLFGAFGLYIEVDIENQRMYGWYKGNIIKSDSFSLDESIESIRSKRRNLELACKEQIRKIKILKTKV